MAPVSEVHIVPEKVIPTRLQEYGVGIFHGFPTRSALKKALKKQFITVDNVVGNTSTWIKGGERIELSVPGEDLNSKKPDISLSVLNEDEHLAAVHKPAGIPVSGNKFRTIANALSQNLKKSELSDATRPQPVHRLDYATSGLLLVGKTAGSIRSLNRLFEERKVNKVYYAVTIGKMKESGTITSEIDGKEARSEFFVLQSVLSEKFKNLNLVRLEPKTGRKHQLRKHLSGLGNPILGDKLYGIEGMILKGKGLYLHAAELEFEHPFTGETFYVEAELPQRFKKIFPEIGPE